MFGVRGLKFEVLQIEKTDLTIVFLRQPQTSNFFTFASLKKNYGFSQSTKY